MLPSRASCGKGDVLDVCYYVPEPLTPAAAAEHRKRARVLTELGFPLTVWLQPPHGPATQAALDMSGSAANRETGLGDPLSFYLEML